MSYSNQITEVTTTATTTIVAASGDVARVVGYISIHNDNATGGTALLYVVEGVNQYEADNLTANGSGTANGMTFVQKRIVLTPTQSLAIDFSAAAGTWTVIAHFEDQAE